MFIILRSLAVPTHKILNVPDKNGDINFNRYLAVKRRERIYQGQGEGKVGGGWSGRGGYFITLDCKLTRRPSESLPE